MPISLRVLTVEQVHGCFPQSYHRQFQDAHCPRSRAGYQGSHVHVAVRHRPGVFACSSHLYRGALVAEFCSKVGEWGVARCWQESIQVVRELLAVRRGWQAVKDLPGVRRGKLGERFAPVHALIDHKLAQFSRGLTVGMDGGSRSMTTWWWLV